MSNNDELPIHASFLESVASPQVKDLVLDFAELTLDAITDDETLKAIPVVRTFVALKGVRERFLLKKTYRFFATLGQLPQDVREAFIRKMRTDPKRAREVGESFAVWLDRLDDEMKAELLARVFELYAHETIDFARSARFASIIDRSHLPYLLQLRRDRYGSRDEWRHDEDLKSHLIALGLMRITSFAADVKRQQWLDRSENSIEYVKIKLNEDGQIFQDYVLEVTPQSHPSL